MDWFLINPQISSVFSSLGSLESGTYIINPNALAILEEINYKLTYEDKTLRTFRRAIGCGQNVRADLIPLLKNTKDENILDEVVRVLVNLTVPVECLFSVDVMYRTEIGRQTIYDLKRLLNMSKEAFTDPNSTKSVVEYMKHILESGLKLSPKKCDQINNCLLLLRNILHTPDEEANLLMVATQNPLAGTQTISMQNAILWNLFIQSIDKLLLYLMTCSQRSCWGFTIVQLIALFYKDQHVCNLQRLLQLWLEASLSESSEDNESNTSPPKQVSGNSSPMLTSDPTSDSSDNGSAGGNNNASSEDRRQALHEEIEATLHEVSRKGQEYQDSMLCTGNISEGSSDLNAATGKGFCRTDKSCKSNDKALQPVEETVNTTKNSQETEQSINFQQQQQQQPADQIINTTNKNNSATINENDGNVMPPPPALLPTSSTSNQQKDHDATIIDQDSATKMSQKSPHSGRFNLTKGTCCPQKRECPSSHSELSDCGYGTQADNPESISTSSNDDTTLPHQKPPCNSKARCKQRIVLTTIDKKELRRKKLVKRSKSSLINMKSLVQYNPTDEDISHLLQQFTIHFLLKGYSYLVEDLHSQLLKNLLIPIDISHFLWLVTYFLKFAIQLELDLKHINTILTYDVISYLTYEGVMLSEQLELNSRQEGSDIKPYVRRLHLVVSAIREFLQTTETYKKFTHLSEEDQNYLQRLQLQMSTSEDLRNLLVLLLRLYSPALQTKQYLQDLIITNHLLLTTMDTVSKLNNDLNINMVEHISQFATLEIMHYYGTLLEDFDKNGKYVNDCIFTMMHHVAGDLGQIETLFQPNILKTYSRAWESDYALCEDWSDLIEYVIHKIVDTPHKSPLTLTKTALTELTKENHVDTAICTWTQEEMDTLYWYYVQSKMHDDVVGKIVRLFTENGNKQKSRISIIQQLLQQDIITSLEYDDLMRFEDAEYQRTLLSTPTSGIMESGIEIKDNSSAAKPSDDIQILRDLIIKEKREQPLVWLQKLLLECCYVKLLLGDAALRTDRQKMKYVMEPMAYHCILKNKSIPVVQWNSDQAITMLYQPFILLLHKLGFRLPADAGSIYAHIPDFWTPQIMYSLAKKLGPLDKLLIKFDASQLEGLSEKEIITSHCPYPRQSFSSTSSLEVEINDVDELSTKIEILPEKLATPSDIFAVPNAKHCHSFIGITPDISLTIPTVPDWLQLVMQCKHVDNTTIENNDSPSAQPATLEEIDANNNDDSKIVAQKNDLLITSNNTKTTTTTNISHKMTTSKATFNSRLPLASTILSITTLAACAATIELNNIHHPIPTLLPCPSVNNIIGVQSVIESNDMVSNENENNNNNNNNNKITTTTTTTQKLINSTLLKVNTAATPKPPPPPPPPPPAAATATTETTHSSEQMPDGSVETITKAKMAKITTKTTTTAAATCKIPIEHEAQQKKQQHNITEIQPNNNKNNKTNENDNNNNNSYHISINNNNNINNNKTNDNNNNHYHISINNNNNRDDDNDDDNDNNDDDDDDDDEDDDDNDDDEDEDDNGDENSVMQILACKDTNIPNDFFCLRVNKNLEKEFTAMIESVYENELANSDCASEASDLTRMYVSDEEDKPDYCNMLTRHY